MTGNRKARIGVIGAGAMGSLHMQHFARLEEAEIVAVADRSEKRRLRARQSYEIPRCYSDGMDLLEDGEIDAVVIATTNATHAPLAIAALETGKHVLLEKPMASSPAGARATLAAARKSGKALLIGHHLRWSWPMDILKRQIGEGRFGEIYYVKAGEFRRKGIPSWGTAYTQSEHMGGGAALDIAVHMLDLVMFLLDDPKPVAVNGAAYSALGPRGLGIGGWGEHDLTGRFDVEDLAAGMIRLDDGGVINLEVSWAANTDAESNERFLQLMGTRGGFSLRSGKAKWMLEAFDEPVDIDLSPPPGFPDPRTCIARHFLDCVAGRATPHVTGRSGYVNNVVLDALYRSASEGREISDLEIDEEPE